jgi:hypothetical protein
MIKDEIKSISERVLSNQGVEEQDLEYACKHIFKDDP